MQTLTVRAMLPLALALMCIVAVHAQQSDRDLRPAKMQPASGTARRIDRTSSLVLTTYAIDGDGSNGPAGSVQPGVALWDANAGTALLRAQVNVPPNGDYDTAVRNVTHDAPYLVRLANSGYLLTYGAASTYIAYKPPASWTCLGRLACQPFKYAPPSSGSGQQVVTALKTSPEYLLPSVGISEITDATIGDTTIMGGQQQPTAPYGQTGSQVYVALHASGNGGTFDTAAGPWNFMTTHAPPANGSQMITYAPTDGAITDFAITRAQAGTGTVTFRLGTAQCRMPVTTNGDANAAAQAIVALFDSACPALRAQYGVMQVTYDPALRIAGTLAAPAAVGIVSRSGNLSAVPGASAISVVCEGAIGCASPSGDNTVLDQRLSGLHRHALGGSLMKFGSYVYYVMNVQFATGTWSGRGQSGQALAIACFRTGAPSGAQWTWTDCAGRHPFTVSPSTPSAYRLDTKMWYVLPAPDSGYRGNMTPYVFDWSARAQFAGNTPIPIPVIAAGDTLPLGDGTLLFAHGCQTKSRVLTACYAIYDTRSGRTRVAGTVDEPSAGGSLASMALAKSAGGVRLAVLTGRGDRFGCAGKGVCLLTYRFNASSTSWTRESVRVLGGDANAGFPGTIVYQDGAFVAHYRIVNGGDVTLTTLFARVP